ncbi:FK506-binding protein 5-like [Trichogramma pretiosum]|uniref:FK506-binding protein 5-like n=1 Tax=Trichogramma pretiosum TaxID=7493 RepID=UPI000C71A3C0|nr:FK506-binding protein 5-like [Trichogramma pretiosum]
MAVPLDQTFCSIPGKIEAAPRPTFTWLIDIKPELDRDTLHLESPTFYTEFGEYQMTLDTAPMAGGKCRECGETLHHVIWIYERRIIVPRETDVMVEERSDIKRHSFELKKGAEGLPVRVCGHSFELFYHEFIAVSEIRDSSRLAIVVTLERPPADIAERIMIPAIHIHRDLCEYFNELWWKGERADVKFVVEGQIMKAHREILAASSDTFREKLRVQASPDFPVWVSLHDVQANAFQVFLRCIYTGQVDNIDRWCLPLLMLAQRYKVDCVKRLCINYMNIVKINSNPGADVKALQLEHARTRAKFEEELKKARERNTKKKEKEVQVEEEGKDDPSVQAENTKNSRLGTEESASTSLEPQYIIPLEDRRASLPGEPDEPPPPYSSPDRTSLPADGPDSDDDRGPSPPPAYSSSPTVQVEQQVPVASTSGSTSATSVAAAPPLSPTLPPPLPRAQPRRARPARPAVPTDDILPGSKPHLKNWFEIQKGTVGTEGSRASSASRRSTVSATSRPSTPTSLPSNNSNRDSNASVAPLPTIPPAELTYLKLDVSALLLNRTFPVPRVPGPEPSVPAERSCSVDSLEEPQKSPEPEARSINEMKQEVNGYLTKTKGASFTERVQSPSLDDGKVETVDDDKDGEKEMTDNCDELAIEVAAKMRLVNNEYQQRLRKLLETSLREADEARKKAAQAELETANCNNKPGGSTEAFNSVLGELLTVYDQVSNNEEKSNEKEDSPEAVDSNSFMDKIVAAMKEDVSLTVEDSKEIEGSGDENETEDCDKNDDRRIEEARTSFLVTEETEASEKTYKIEVFHTTDNLSDIRSAANEEISNETIANEEISNQTKKTHESSTSSTLPKEAKDPEDEEKSNEKKDCDKTDDRSIGEARTSFRDSEETKASEETDNIEVSDTTKDASEMRSVVRGTSSSKISETSETSEKEEKSKETKQSHKSNDCNGAENSTSLTVSKEAEAPEDEEKANEKEDSDESDDCKLELEDSLDSSRTVSVIEDSIQILEETDNIDIDDMIQAVEIRDALEASVSFKVSKKSEASNETDEQVEKSDDVKVSQKSEDSKSADDSLESKNFEEINGSISKENSNETEASNEIKDAAENEDSNEVEEPVPAEDPQEYEDFNEVEEAVPSEDPLEYEDSNEVEVPVPAEDPQEYEGSNEVEEPVPIEDPLEYEDSNKVEEPVPAEDPQEYEGSNEVEEPLPIEDPLEYEDFNEVEEAVPSEDPLQYEDSNEVEEPVPVEDPLEYEGSNEVEEPVPIEYPLEYEDSNKVEESVPAEDPLEYEDYNEVEEAVPSEDPLEYEGSNEVEEPVPIEDPLEYEDSNKVEEPVPIEDPLEYEDSNKVEEPVPVEDPLEYEDYNEVAEPVPIEYPLEYEDYYEVAEPVPIEYPLEYEDSNEVEEPVPIEDPQEYEDSNEVEEPVPIEDPQEYEDSNEVEEPVPIEDPQEYENSNEVEEPIPADEPRAIEISSEAKNSTDEENYDAIGEYIDDSYKLDLFYKYVEKWDLR